MKFGAAKRIGIGKKKQDILKRDCVATLPVLERQLDLQKIALKIYENLMKVVNLWQSVILGWNF